MEYSLDFFTYWKYHLLVLYYWLGEYPPIVRFTAIFILINFFLAIFALGHDFLKSERDAAFNRRLKRYRKRFYEGMREIALSPEVYSVAEITEKLRLSSRARVKLKKWKSYVPLFRRLYVDVKDNGVNMENWRNLLYAFKMPTFFEVQVRSRKTKERLDALKDVSDICCDLKEATASRYLYAKDDALRLTARLHAARYGTSYPFQVFVEDAKKEFTDEMCVKLHWVIKTRQDLGLSIPNFIRWCGMAGASKSFRLFSINEIRLFGLTADCPELLNLLKSSKDEDLSCAMIKALGELKYEPAEQEFFRRYMYAGIKERLALADALGTINSGNPEVVRFLVDDYHKATSAVNKVSLLRVLYDYGTTGRSAFMQLKASAPESDRLFFEHIESDLIDSKDYA